MCKACVKLYNVKIFNIYYFILLQTIVQNLKLSAKPNLVQNICLKALVKKNDILKSKCEENLEKSWNITLS